MQNGNAAVTGKETSKREVTPATHAPPRTPDNPYSLRPNARPADERDIYDEPKDFDGEERRDVTEETLPMRRAHMQMIRTKRTGNIAMTWSG
jgi:hypothetical protein